MATIHTLGAPGVRLHYEVRGDGPLLLVTGAPMAASEFASLADALAADHTVVTHDPRGVSGSVLDDPGQDSTPALRADDLVAILDDLGAGSADVFGSSGGAVTGLAMVERHPDRVRTLVAHEPPLLELLPDAAEQRVATDDIVETFHRDGIGAAWMKFMTNAGFVMGGDDAPAPPQGEPSEEDIANSVHFFDHELVGTARHIPDVAALKAASSRVLVGVGAASGNLVTYRTSLALCELLGTRPVEFPGDHGGFMGQPKEFAEVLRKALAG